MADAVHIARLRISILERTDETRCAAYRALGQPFGETDEAAEFAARNYYDASQDYGRIGLGLYAKQCLLAAADCHERLGENDRAAKLRERAAQIEVAWEGEQ
jgi:hypothetical protein